MSFDPNYDNGIPDDVYGSDSSAGYDSPSTEEIAATIAVAIETRLQQYGAQYSQAYFENALLAADSELQAHFGDQWNNGLRDKALERWKGIEPSAMLSPFQVAESLKVAAYDELFANAKSQEEEKKQADIDEWNRVKSSRIPNPWTSG